MNSLLSPQNLYMKVKKREFFPQKVHEKLLTQKSFRICKGGSSDFNTDFRNYEYPVTIANPDIRGNFF